MSRLRFFLRNVFRRAAVEQELDEELASFLEEDALERARSGLDPATARRAAAVWMSGTEAVKEAVREARSGASIEGALRDASLALRQLRRDPGFGLAVILSLALAIGANTAVFSVVQAVLLAPLPYGDPERLHMIWSNSDRAGYLRAPLSGPELQDLREGAPLYEGFAAIWSTTAQIAGDGAPQQLRVALVTANFFSLLGVSPALGRGFEAAEEGPGAPRVVVLSDGLWRSRFGSDPAILGRRVRLDGDTVTVVGVAPRGLRLWFPSDANVPADPQLIAPFPFDLRSERALYYLRTFGRVRTGADDEAAREQVAALGRRIEKEHVEYAASGRSLFATSLAADTVREARPVLVVLFGAVLVVLLLACVNVASLVIGRDLGRRGQMAVRAALGATRTHLGRQAFVETLLLAVLGVGVGLGLGLASLRLLLTMRPPGLERFEEVHLDPVVLIFTAGLGVLASLLVSVVAASGALGIDVAHALRESGRGSDGGRGRARRVLVAAEVAMGATLLVGAGLMVRTVDELGRVDPGFRPEGVETFRLSLPVARYPTAEAGVAFDRRLEERLRALPGVRAVGSVSALPFDTLPNWSTPYTFDGVPEGSRGGREADARAIGPGYFAAIGAHLVAGRDFDEGDAPGKAPAVIVDERLAARAWPRGDAIGRRLQVEFLVDGSFVPTWATVVGVVQHIRHRRLQEVVREQVYVPQRQSPRQPHAYVLSVTRNGGALAGAIRREVKTLDPELPVYDERPLAAYVGDALARSRFAMRLAASFAILALLVAGVGVYSVVSHSVARRRREIGVRLALGAVSRDVLRSVLGEGLSLTAGGLFLGLGAAMLLGRAARSLLFGVSPFDPATYAVVGGLLGGAALVASALPAYRASRTDPTEVLRSE